MKDDAKKHAPPAWWTESLETSWKRVKKDALAEWGKFVGAEKRLEADLEEEAVSFGYGARKAYQKMQAWSDELETRLKADWKDSHETQRAWTRVRDAVKHGWKSAGAGDHPPVTPSP